MKTILLTCLTLKPETGGKVDLQEGYEGYLVFSPSFSHLNMGFVDAKLDGQSISCRNTDEVYEHELWIIQFETLPPFFQIAPWQVLIKGRLHEAQW